MINENITISVIGLKVIKYNNDNNTMQLFYENSYIPIVIDATKAEYVYYSNLIKTNYTFEYKFVPQTFTTTGSSTGTTLRK